MKKEDEPQELASLDDTTLNLIKIKQFDISDLMWQTKDNELIKLSMIPDSHLRNIALMLMGMGYQTYKASDDLKIKWLTVLRIEWEKRMRERSAKFNKNY